eukprot:CAMPEP_0196667802 /NCGR_PEP_ID=MMETSP1086-20130531/65280_1 /TAXON_ID=77921 /ORGANISM="Cyanoptyche  gloeocystis , Strain SAG4.97" /LENGTH=391 /DNA_ID=CAMNT_0042005161 /DNA_START=88 /DNA_END=1264 /DNA_ORIENTATION=-
MNSSRRASRDVQEGEIDDVDIVDGDMDIFYDDDEEEFSFEGTGGSKADAKFDLTVGALEEVVMDPDFTEKQSSFILKYCGHFEGGEENKLIYSDIFNSYVDLIEKYIEQRLAASVPDFSMEEFMKVLSSRGENDQVLSHIKAYRAKRIMNSGCRDVQEEDTDDVDIVDEDMDIFEDEDDEEFSLEGTGGSKADAKFDLTVGALEEIVMDPDFTQKQRSFILKHCVHFEEGEENKLIYSDIFNSYVDLLEKYIEQRLAASVPDFSMEEFMKVLSSRGENEMSADVFDMLLSLGDFDNFKDMMLSIKRTHADVFDMLLSLGDFDNFKDMMLSYKTNSKCPEKEMYPEVQKMLIHSEEDEDGVPMPDLNMLLSVQALTPNKSKTKSNVSTRRTR